MKLKPGYKQTEVGVIPEEWEIQPGERITSLIGKGGSPRWQGFAYSDHGMLFVTSENVRDGFLQISEPKYLPLAFHEKLSRTKLRKHDILVNLVGASIGRSCQIKEDLGEANVNQAVAVFRVSEGHFSDYLAFYFQAPATIERILGMQVDAARPNISLSDLRRFPIPIPPLPEQLAIAEALGDVDALLGALDRLIAKKRDLKQAAMQQLLTGKTRLPGFLGEWEVKRLGDVATTFSGGTPSTAVPSYFTGDIPWITSGDLNMEYITSVQGRISEAALLSSAAQMVEVNTLLIALYGATSGVAAISKIRAAINQAVLAIVPREDSALFLYFKFRSIQDWVVATYTQGGQANLSGEIVRGIQFPMPPLPEQTAIAEVLSDMDAEIAALEQRREKTRALKQGMMQELLTGRTRLV